MSQSGQFLRSDGSWVTIQGNITADSLSDALEKRITVYIEDEVKRQLFRILTSGKIEEELAGFLADKL